ncbi:hypothetical protein E1A91_A05G416500v1 [Gossypium mustelinum]|uniref:Uncharacterized protein n=1 Tax=Gossypium mustelinum TaxID=34275 RepID=A0A5D2ZJZ8_GOSMU|nr:hypothetical protein E1A91_A05G416500v1 [Gossypium mustelinum]
MHHDNSVGILKLCHILEQWAYQPKRESSPSSISHPLAEGGKFTICQCLSRCNSCGIMTSHPVTKNLLG